jgi:hypothetical protein
MIDYLSPSQHKMRKSSPCSSAAGNAPTLPIREGACRPYEFLTQRGVSYFARRPSERLMSLFDLLIGKPIATTEERAEHIGPIAGIPV